MVLLIKVKLKLNIQLLFNQEKERGIKKMINQFLFTSLLNEYL
jgi:hypothetical protein